MRADERRVYFYDIEVSTNKVNATPPTMREVADGLINEFKNGEPKLSIENNRADIQISDIKVFDDYIVCYAGLSDRAAPDVYFSDLVNKQSRVERKGPGEGRGFGVHFVISLIANPKSVSIYLCVLEKNTGLHRGLINRLLQGVLRNLYKRDEQFFQCDHVGGARDKTGSPKQVNFRPMLVFAGHPSSSFIDQLEGGVLKEITLIHSEKKASLGGSAWLQKEETSLRIVPDKGAVKNVVGVWKQLINSIGKKKDNFETARIKFYSNDTEKIETVLIDTGSGELLDDRFVRSVMLGSINPPLDEGADKIVAHFSEKIEGLMKKELKTYS